MSLPAMRRRYDLGPGDAGRGVARDAEHGQRPDVDRWRKGTCLSCVEVWRRRWGTAASHSREGRKGAVLRQAAGVPSKPAAPSARHAARVANVQQPRNTEVARLDALQAALWPSVMAVGHVDGVAQVLAIIERRAKLLGLYPQGKHRAEEPLRPVTVIVPEGWTYDDQRRQWQGTS